MVKKTKTSELLLMKYIKISKLSIRLHHETMWFHHVKLRNFNIFYYYYFTSLSVLIWYGKYNFIKVTY